MNGRIAILGKSNSGKNTIAEMLIDCLKFDGSKEKIVALADPIKNIVKMMFPEAKDECLWGASGLRSNIIDEKYKDANGNSLTYREALMNLGSLGRRYNNDVWLNVLTNDAKKSKHINTYIVSDVRFCNEAAYLKNAGFTMIKVIRNSVSNINDISEKEQDLIDDSEFDFIIDNNGTIDQLRLQIEIIANSVRNLQFSSKKIQKL